MRRSRTGYLLYLNNALIKAVSRKQLTVECSVFGSEFVAMKNCMEDLRGLRYKLRMMGIPVPGPSYVFGDNQAVIYNTLCPESTLKKKSNAICYHAVREAVAMGEMVTIHVRSADNLADLMTKCLTGQKRFHLVDMVLHDIYEGGGLKGGIGAAQG